MRRLMAYLFNVSCSVILNKRAKKDARIGKRKVQNSKGEKKEKGIKKVADRYGFFFQLCHFPVGS